MSHFNQATSELESAIASGDYPRIDRARQALKEVQSNPLTTDSRADTLDRLFWAAFDVPGYLAHFLGVTDTDLLEN